MDLTRREFIRLGSGALAGIAMSPLPPKAQDASEKACLGRVTEWSVRVHTEPDHSAPTVRYHRHDDIVSTFGTVETEGRNSNNPVWFRVIGGYIYSSDVQPVEVCLNVPLQWLPPGGLWGEISVPYTTARYSPSPTTGRSYRLYYSSVYRIAEAVWGSDHQLWYRLHESQSPQARRYVLAKHVRPLRPEDMRPISPDVENKRIEISLAGQRLVAFEDDGAVFETLISGGTGGDRSTPRGEHQVVFKSPSRHMIGEDYNLPGVSFDTYFWNSVAIHGAYWHNDFGRPRSHGCVNVPAQAAKWLFRWTLPVFPYRQDTLRVREGGTTVVVY